MQPFGTGSIAVFKRAVTRHAAVELRRSSPLYNDHSLRGGVGCKVTVLLANRAREGAFKKCDIGWGRSHTCMPSSSPNAPKQLVTTEARYRMSCTSLPCTAVSLKSPAVHTWHTHS